MPTSLSRSSCSVAVALAACLHVHVNASDIDALQLEADSDTAPQQAVPPKHKLFLEAGVGAADQRYGLGSRTIGRAAVDGRYATRLASSVQGAVSARLDWSDPADPRINGPVFSFREGYVGWQDDGAAHVVELGRITLRESPGYGYNPTDFFRDNALRTYSAVDPGTLRDYRLGAVMVRGQRLWSDGSIAAVFAPKLADGPSDASYTFDWGATNARDRGQLSLAYRPSEALTTDVLVYKEAGSDARIGASINALISDAAVAYVEGTYSREPTLLERSVMQSEPTDEGHRLNLGASYTTSTRLSLTAEYHYNGFALSRDQWQSLQLEAPAVLADYYLQAVALQDSASRHAAFVYAVQRDLLTKNLDLTALLKYNHSDESRLVWFDLTYRMQRFDVSLRGQRNIGGSGSEYGVPSIKSSLGVLLVAYL